MTKCYVCEKGTLQVKNVDYTLYGIVLGKFGAEVCGTCHEIFFSEEVSREITDLAKEKGLFGLEAKTKIGRVGTALDVRFPKKLVEFYRLKKGAEVTIKPEDRNKVIITF